MKFGETFMEYLRGDQEWFLGKCTHVEYKRLKKVLKSCRTCTTLQHSCDTEQENEKDALSGLCQCESCPLCDQKFFSELMKEASDIAGCFNSRVRHLLDLHIASGLQRYVLRLRQCFKNDQQIMVHSSVNGKKFKTKMRAERIELLQSPWIIELGAFYLNFNRSDSGDSDEVFSHFSCDLGAMQPVMTLKLPDSVKLEYNLTCAICLDIVFNPYALSCGHLFCKLCACSAASVMIFQGLKAANPESKCPICREVGVYANAVHMLELDLLVKKRCKGYWKERQVAERAEMAKQSKEYWDLQTKYAIGY
ncbi:probable E3 ubiquitin-protein ligase BAH1-like isoform X2 [Malania oleifera]|uniref:probable E3 ubiquitin-protein ligase BAH1-like isoform X2 n=1 Tax=Malania oleifera TaxID=397392 RepID=UPI0025AECA0F|nr:probable E3 ubiquitin-protein ligase BAH1-like isoform X2 [Malania oleifera]